MSEEEARLFVALTREIRLTKADNVARNAELRAALTRAKEQIATSHDLLAQLDSLLQQR